MKANVPRAWGALSQKERESIDKYCTARADEQIYKNTRIVLDLYIKMVCVMLHDSFGFGERRLMRFLGTHRRFFVHQRKMVADDTQIEYLNRRVAEIFKKDGFPKEFFDKSLGELPEGKDG